MTSLALTPMILVITEYHTKSHGIWLRIISVHRELIHTHNMNAYKHAQCHTTCTTGGGLALLHFTSVVV